MLLLFAETSLVLKQFCVYVPQLGTHKQQTALVVLVVWGRATCKLQVQFNERGRRRVQALALANNDFACFTSTRRATGKLASSLPAARLSAAPASSLTDSLTHLCKPLYTINCTNC